MDGVVVLRSSELIKMYFGAEFPCVTSHTTSHLLLGYAVLQYAEDIFSWGGGVVVEMASIGCPAAETAEAPLGTDTSASHSL